MKRTAVLTAILALAGLSAVWAEDAKFTALFVLNFAKYVEWPTEGQTGDLVITVVGEGAVVDELRTLAGKTTAGERTIVVRQAASTDQVQTTHILYLCPSKHGQLAAALAKFPSGVLVVANGDGLAAQGAAINLVEIEGKQRYEINTAALKKCGLGAKPVLFKLGKVVGS
jgi:hypothetical protein